MPLTVDVWKRFAPEQLATGGLGPHLRMMAHLSSTFERRSESAWFLGCYIGPYVPTTGWLIHREFPTPDTVTWERVFGFIQSEWAGLPVRRGDRRAVSSAAKLATFIASYAGWVQHALPDIVDSDYETIRRSARNQIGLCGRFTAIKLLEALRLAGVIAVELSDGILPNGAQSGPRKALQQLADSEGIECDLVTGNRPDKLEEVNRAARWAESLLEGVPPLSWFQLEGMLCDARQAVKGRYPGRALDEDLEYHLQCESVHGPVFPEFYTVRRELFPATSLGEVGGWSGKRVDKEKEWSQG